MHLHLDEIIVSILNCNPPFEFHVLFTPHLHSARQERWCRVSLRHYFSIDSGASIHHTVIKPCISWEWIHRGSELQGPRNCNRLSIDVCTQLLHGPPTHCHHSYSGVRGTTKEQIDRDGHRQVLGSANLGIPTSCGAHGRRRKTSRSNGLSRCVMYWWGGILIPCRTHDWGAVVCHIQIVVAGVVDAVHKSGGSCGLRIKGVIKDQIQVGGTD
mmetsp:Transcript_66065/g.110236  ORF Transcript_66065/g.110236 Transcript_66065/m.110236 type:complete len:213 (-) Transcript_66065:664-1302(-)